MNIYIVLKGEPGTGKSTVGRLVEKYLSTHRFKTTKVKEHEYKVCTNKIKEPPKI